MTLIDDAGFNPYGPVTQLPLFPGYDGKSEWVYLVQWYTPGLGINIALWKKSDSLERSVFATGLLCAEPRSADEEREILAMLEEQDESLSDYEKIINVIEARAETVTWDWTPLIDKTVTIDPEEIETVWAILPQFIAGEKAELLGTGHAILGIANTRHVEGEVKSWVATPRGTGSFWGAANQLLEIAQIAGLPPQETGKRHRE